MRELQKIIGYTFKDQSLLETALTHTSYANEVYKDGLKSYERLEFLGDSILGFTTADYLIGAFPQMHEGELTKLRAELVCEASLAVTAQKLGLGDYLRLGKGEEAGGGRRRVSIIADVVEAVIAAIYLDGGLSAAKCFIYTYVLADTGARLKLNTDYKTMLQELVQQKKNQSLSYELLSESGPDHDKQFSVRVLLNGNEVGRGDGTSKKRAEQAAAKTAVETLFPQAAASRQ
ncbi:MAG: ribonuclease III [Oscillospiraceae bacterium]|nr:ribonuclease III [Oscillospiraceae bacterium]